MNLIKNKLRYLTFLIGFLAFIFPFALLTRLVFFLMGSQELPDMHSACLRMPINWLFQDRLLSAVLRNPLYLTFIVITLAALFFGPIWCGWLCPTGAFTELLSRFVPKRFQIRRKRESRFSPTPIRYGFFLGFLLMPILHVGSVCCGYCDFSQLQRLTGNLFGFSGGHYYSYGWSFSMTAVITLVVWLFVLGIFTKGGRGWCNFACPLGALQGIVHALGAKLGYTWRIERNDSECSDCEECVDACPMWAKDKTEDGIRTNRFACIVCQECVKACQDHALSYQKGAGGV